jgi:DNA-binding beta-propeller fold protein YncE
MSGVGRAGFIRARRVPMSLRRGAAPAAACACALVFWACPAWALSQRGHVLGPSFGSAGTGDGQLAEPGAVAVDEASGDVYVVDQGNDRIERFGPSGEFIAAWGFGVSDGEQRFEVCTSGCTAGTGKGVLAAPGAIAVDNSSGPSAGDVYVVMDARAGHGALWKLTADGEKVGVLHQEGTKGEKWEGALDGVAVDRSGTVWVYRAVEASEGILEHVGGGQENEFLGALPAELDSSALEATHEGEAAFCPKPGLAVDGAGEEVYMDHERDDVGEECPEAVRLEEEAELKERHSKAAPLEALAPVVAAKLHFNSAEQELEGLIGGLGVQDTTATAVDQASGGSSPLGPAAKGDVYVANGASVGVFDAGGAPVQSVALPRGAQSAGLAVDSRTGDVYVSDAASGEVAVLVPAGAGGPVIDGVLANVQSAGSTRLVAKIDPDGADTHVALEYGTTSCLENASACSEAPGSPEDVGAGFGDQLTEVTLNGLQPDTTYYYRVIARSGHDTVESPLNAQTFFVTLPSAATELADRREWELVSPPRKEGLLEAISAGEPGAVIQSAADGHAITYGAPDSGPAGEAQGNRSIQTTQFLSVRGEKEWSTQDITTPHDKAEGTIPGEPPEFQAFSPELSLALVEPEGKVAYPVEALALSPLLEGETEREKTIYLRDDPPLRPGAEEAASYEAAQKNSEYLAPGYSPLITKQDDSAGSAFGQSLELSDASPNLQHVVFKSQVPLTAGATGEGLYEWNAQSPGALQPISLLPESAEAAPEAILGGFHDYRGAISDDGAHVFFTGAYEKEIETRSGEQELLFNEAAYLLMRDTATGRTIQINGVQGEGFSEPSQAELGNEEVDQARFQVASADGSRVFFKDSERLTEESKLHPSEEYHPSDLYEYALTPGQDTGTLTDLTVDTNVGESADVLGTIPGIGQSACDEGSIEPCYVYFVANGVLAPGASPGDCLENEKLEQPLAGLTCNLYVSETSPRDPGAHTTRFIATLSAEDAPDWDGGPKTPSGDDAGDLAYMTARVSPGGRYLAFMSDRSLVGYDNEDISSKQPGERLDEEVYLYDVQRGRLACASCNPEDEGDRRPEGVLDTVEAGEGLGLLVDRPKIWEGRWLAGSIPGWTPLDVESAIYQSRYLSNDGRLFFNSADALVPEDKNRRSETIDGSEQQVGGEDVYEYEPQGLGSCQQQSGCVSLISSGDATDQHESAFLDASENGDDVFFLTSEKLVPSAVEPAFEVYDARVCDTSESESCLPPPPPPTAECAGEACKPPSPAAPTFPASATATFTGPGNPANPNHGVEHAKTAQPPKPARAQELAKALRICRKLAQKKKRIACERAARKRYGPKTRAKRSKQVARKAKHSLRAARKARRSQKAANRAKKAVRR